MFTKKDKNTGLNIPKLTVRRNKPRPDSTQKIVDALDAEILKRTVALVSMDRITVDRWKNDITRILNLVEIKNEILKGDVHYGRPPSYTIIK